ncbi:all-trans retinoic acid-induced differentiation factor [Genypterus blacodes]|uniref:all-trans retinoic acid-induced differentiation factor n=1 Tax=Genypterus blacodes TaxID=154954 RepID=UPI003F774270
MKMKAGCCRLKPAVVILTIFLCFYPTYQLSEFQLCNRCNGTVLQPGTAVGQLCNVSAGRIDGRCCWRYDNTSDHEHIIGLDLSRCSLSQVDGLSDASTALIIDLSLNEIVNMSDSVFLGFIDLNFIILPPDMVCPGGNSSWESVEVKGGNLLCRGQKNMCNQTGQLSFSCPENSLCAPYGPGLFACSCLDKYHGYKCLRQGEFPALQVFGPLWGATVLISILLWFTQRRKVISG